MILYLFKMDTLTLLPDEDLGGAIPFTTIELANKFLSMMNEMIKPQFKEALNMRVEEFQVYDSEAELQLIFQSISEINEESKN